ncbi:MAG: hypothetical protein JST81_02205 [Bacteroidetes bacterium]|nr:hypothetical protein [Bacteroidota bacterium]
MRYIFLLSLFISCYTAVFASADTVLIPLQRRYFHDKIDKQQQQCDKADGKEDNYFRLGTNEEINLRLTDVLFRKIDALQEWVETNDSISNNNEKIRYLSYIENVLKDFRIAWKKKEISPLDFPLLEDNFETIIRNQAAGGTMTPIIDAAPYPIASILTEIFFDNPGYADSKKIMYKKYCIVNPDKILQTIRPYVDEPFADTLIALAARRNPVQLYTYAQSNNSPEGILIHRNTDSMVMAVAKLSQTPDALFYFPFLDDILSGKQPIDSIKKYVDGPKGYDSVGYFKLLVRTEIDYYTRLTSIKRDTPVAMFGANGLRETLKGKALEHFIRPINDLHEQSNLAIRMRAIDPLSPEELYYMMVMGENDIFTSSFKHSFNRMLQKMGGNPRGDSLLMKVNFDYFKKFIKLTANYNKLDTFLRSMPAANSETLMRAFVNNLDKGTDLEDATDVADSYSSINDKKLQVNILNNVIRNEEQSIANNNNRGAVIYGLLKQIFLSADSANKVNLTETLGIPSIYELKNSDLADDSGRIIQQVFFYGDDDGKQHFPAFINSFASREWKVTQKKEWYEIRSVKGNVWIFANRPLENDKNLDDSAQVHLNKYLESNDMKPTVVIHRGHSYWLPGTIDRMPGDAKIVVLGSCGGYKNLNTILEICPDANIISTKEIGTGSITQPIQNYLNQSMISGNKIVWKDMWNTLTKSFSKDPSREKRDSWDDYIPPYKNLAAIFIKAYNKKME